MTVTDFLQAKSNDPMENIFCKPTYPREALQVLYDHFVPDDVYCVDPIGPEQVRTEMVAYILTTHESWRFKRLPFWKRWLFKLHCKLTDEPLYHYF